MAAHLLVLYPIPEDAEAFDRAYHDEHLPYAGPRLVGATGVVTRRVARSRRIAANDNARPFPPGSWIPDHPWLYRETVYIA